MSPDETVQLVKDAQRTWAQLIVAGDSKAVTDLYASAGDIWHLDSAGGSGSHKCTLAFNPTLDDNFLTTPHQALHYFEGTAEKPGFARKGWIRVIFDPNEHPKARRFITPTSDGAIAVGRYVFEKEDAVVDTAGDEVLAVVRIAVDYTFIYKKFGDNLKIIGHHSSLPLSQKSVK